MKCMKYLIIGLLLPVHLQLRRIAVLSSGLQCRGHGVRLMREHAPSLPGSLAAASTACDPSVVASAVPTVLVAGAIGTLLVGIFFFFLGKLRLTEERRIGRGVGRGVKRGVGRGVSFFI